MTVLLYSALPDEVPTQQLMDTMLSKGNTVLLPRVTTDTDMELRRYTGPESLERGAFGILEPTGELFTDYDNIDLALIPGVAFDHEGHRMGRGRGYYDRFLPRLTRAVKVGICHAWRIFPVIPAEEHDIAMDYVIAVNEL